MGPSSCIIPEHSLTCCPLRSRDSSRLTRCASRFSTSLSQDQLKVLLQNPRVSFWNPRPRSVCVLQLPIYNLSTISFPLPTGLSPFTERHLWMASLHTWPAREHRCTLLRVKHPRKQLSSMLTHSHWPPQPLRTGTAQPGGAGGEPGLRETEQPAQGHMALCIREPR